jgi:glycyl-tRNA synthetase beta chain
MLSELIGNALAALPIPKRMRWGAGDAEFVRPLHWVCVLFGDERVEGEILGIEIGRTSRGHRFHHPDSVEISHPQAYCESLRAAFVEPSLTARRERIADQVLALAESVQGRPSMPGSLLDEVTALCEWPVALLGRFDRRYLEVPPEVLVETMQKNQKYFPVLDQEGALMPFFVTVSNIESREPALVRAGNERVIRPRFSDAMFFWNQDRQQPLEHRSAALSKVIFQQQLGSIGDKCHRLEALCRVIAEELGYNTELAARAALLGKCDLVTSMVGEFPSLQGTMGRYYAAHDGEDPCVVSAMEEQYLPRHAGDALPATDCGRALALADKIDTLIGIFAIGQRPTGVKDPYGLRRAAIGALRMLIETPLPLDLKGLLDSAAAGYADSVGASGAVQPVLDYIAERLPGYYADRQIGGDIVDAVLATGVTTPSDLDRRILAVAAFRRLREAEALAAANKRIGNILKKTSAEAVAGAVDQSRLTEPAEQRLAERIADKRAETAPLLAQKDYEAVLRSLADLRDDVDAFFDNVMVMVEDQALRANRLAILQALEQLFLSVADISRLQPEATG